MAALDASPCDSVQSSVPLVAYARHRGSAAQAAAQVPATVTPSITNDGVTLPGTGCAKSLL